MRVTNHEAKFLVDASAVSSTKLSQSFTVSMQVHDRAVWHEKTGSFYHEWAIYNGSKTKQTTNCLLYLPTEVLELEHDDMLRERRCQICHVRLACCVFPPCLHMVICSVCGTETCPQCMQKIRMEERRIALLCLRVLQQGSCQMCHVNQACCKFLPDCQHTAICSMCKAKTCPQCGQAIQEEDRVVSLHWNEWHTLSCKHAIIIHNPSPLSFRDRRFYTSICFTCFYTSICFYICMIFFIYMYAMCVYTRAFTCICLCFKCIQ